MAFQKRLVDDSAASKTAVGTVTHDTASIMTGLLLLGLNNDYMQMTVAEMLELLKENIDALSDEQKRLLQGLPAYLNDFSFVEQEVWTTATDMELVALDPNEAQATTQIGLLAAGSVPTLTGWAASVSTTQNEVIVARIPLAAHASNYRLHEARGGVTTFERLQFIPERARNSEYKFISTLNAERPATFTAQHHGVDHHTKYGGELDDVRVAQALPDALETDQSLVMTAENNVGGDLENQHLAIGDDLRVAEVQFSPNQILQTDVPGNIRAHVRMVPGSFPTATRVRMAINGVWSNTAAFANTFTVRTTFTPDQQNAIQAKLTLETPIPVTIQFLTGEPGVGTVVYDWTSTFPQAEPFVFSAASESEAKNPIGTALRSWAANRIATAARSQRPVARVDMFPNYIVRPGYRGDYKLVIQDFQTEFLTGVTKILIRVQGEAVHTENWTPRNINDTQRTIDFEITQAEADNIITALTSGGNVEHPETAVCEISFRNASNVAIAQVYYSLLNLSADEVPGNVDTHTALRHQHTVTITSPDTNVWKGTGYTLVAGKLIYVEVDDPPQSGTTASNQSETHTGFFLSDTLLAKAAQTIDAAQTDRQGQIVLEEMFMSFARNSANQMLLSRHDNRYDAAPLRIYHAEISTTVGADGKVIYGDTNRPANNVGKVGDTYFRRQSNGIGLYEKTASETWTYRYALLLLPTYPSTNQRHEKVLQFAGNTLAWDYYMAAEWANIPVGTTLKVGTVLRHHTNFFGCIAEHDKATTTPDADATNWVLLSNYGGAWSAKAAAQGTIVTHAGNPYIATAPVLATDVAPNHANNSKWFQLNDPPNIVRYAEMTVQANQTIPIPSATPLALNFATAFVKSNEATGVIARSSNAHEINLNAGSYQIDCHIVLNANSDNRRNNYTVQITQGATVLDEKKYIDYVRGLNLSLQAIDSSHLITLSANGRIQVRIRRTSIEGNTPYEDVTTAADSTVTIRKL